MNAMAEKLKEAGADTIGARFTAACTEAIRQYPGSIDEAWRFVGATFGHEFIRGIMADMKPKGQTIEPPSSSPLPMIGVPTSYKPRVILPERLEKRRELQQVIRSKYKNSGGVVWSEVGWHELHGMKRDGAEAKALLEAGPANFPNNLRTVGEVLGVQRVDEIINSVRK